MIGAASRFSQQRRPQSSGAAALVCVWSELLGRSPSVQACSKRSFVVEVIATSGVGWFAQQTYLSHNSITMAGGGQNLFAPLTAAPANAAKFRRLTLDTAAPSVWLVAAGCDGGLLGGRGGGRLVASPCFYSSLRVEDDEGRGAGPLLAAGGPASLTSSGARGATTSARYWLPGRASSTGRLDTLRASLWWCVSGLGA